MSRADRPRFVWFIEETSEVDWSAFGEIIAGTSSLSLWSGSGRSLWLARRFFDRFKKFHCCGLMQIRQWAEIEFSTRKKRHEAGLPAKTVVSTFYLSRSAQWSSLVFTKNFHKSSEITMRDFEIGFWVIKRFVWSHRHSALSAARLLWCCASSNCVRDRLIRSLRAWCNFSIRFLLNIANKLCSIRAIFMVVKASRFNAIATYFSLASIVLVGWKKSKKPSRMLEFWGFNDNSPQRRRLERLQAISKSVFN